MSQVFNETISKAREASFSKKLGVLLAQLHETNLETLKIRRDIDRLKKANDRSFERAKKAVEALAKY